MQNFDVVIIGAGAAGMMCASEAGKRLRRVALIDHSRKLGRKILISGGGRCNFTNVNAGPEAYVSQNPHFVKSALSRYRPEDFIAKVKAHGIAFHEKKLGQLFCDDSAEQIVALLAGECQAVNVAFRLENQVEKIEKGDGFVVHTNHDVYTCQSLVIATGGLSVPQVGATGFGYKVAEQFGLGLIKPSPALDGFVLAPEDLKLLAELAGVSKDTVVSASGASFRENILFTHTGLSGPASLQASLYWQPDSKIEIDLLPGVDIFNVLLQEKMRSSKMELKNVLSDYMPKRLAEKFCQLYMKSRPLNQIADKDLGQLAAGLKDWQLKPASTVGYKKAEVTRGGVDTRALSSQTMEALKVPGLYFIGEVVDVTGQLGGYNFQWAWSSGYVCGQVV